MFKNLLLVVLLFLSICGFAQSRARKEVSTTSSETTLQLKVKLLDQLDAAHLPASCGVYEPIEVPYQYKVLEVLSGNYKTKTIWINLRCPREQIENKLLENNKEYTYTLKPSSKLHADGSVMYEVVDKP